MGRILSGVHWLKPVAPLFFDNLFAGLSLVLRFSPGNRIRRGKKFNILKMWDKLVLSLGIRGGQFPRINWRTFSSRLFLR